MLISPFAGLRAMRFHERLPDHPSLTRIRQLSAIIIPPCYARVADATAGLRKINGCINVTVGARKAFMARPRHGTDLRAPSGAASAT